MEVIRLPALSDNYIFLLHDPQTGTAAVVDPAEAAPVLRHLKALGASLTAILNTHHHGDHIGGNRGLLRHFPDAVVYGGVGDRGRIPEQRVELSAGDTVTFGGETAEIFFVPGHTRSHIAYFFPASGHLFCGDTLFAGGCGRLFEGTPAQMVDSLSQLRDLPGDTQVWCAHEYTLKNLKFAITVDQQNPHLWERLDSVKAARSRGKATVPTRIDLERATNPFLRWDQPALQAVAHSTDPVQVFARIRSLKDQF